LATELGFVAGAAGARDADGDAAGLAGAGGAEAATGLATAGACAFGPEAWISEDLGGGVGAPGPLRGSLVEAAGLVAGAGWAFGVDVGTFPTGFVGTAWRAGGAGVLTAAAGGAMGFDVAGTVMGPFFGSGGTSRGFSAAVLC